MEALAIGLSWALNQSLSSQDIFGRLGVTLGISYSANIWTELSAKLSSNASIVFPDEPLFDSYVSRWRDWHAPDVGVIVNVFNEDDILASVSSVRRGMFGFDKPKHSPQVQFSNEQKLPFIARSGGHGATESLRLAKNVVSIDLRGIDQVVISEDGETATIGGGANVKEVVNTLWAAGKQTGMPSQKFFRLSELALTIKSDRNLRVRWHFCPSSGRRPRVASGPVWPGFGPSHLGQSCSSRWKARHSV